MLRGQREKPRAYACPKCQHFEGIILGDFSFLNVKAGNRPGEPQGRVVWDGVGATSVRGDQRPEVSGQGQEPSALSLQQANKSLCILLPSFPFQPIFSVTN